MLGTLVEVTVCLRCPFVEPSLSSSAVDAACAAAPVDVVMMTQAHHYLHDANAFDAHIYGSGAPEEFHILWMELLVATVLQWTPPSLTYYVLYISWTNKVGHTRKATERGGNNAHVDHHTYHSKNFGIYNAVMDMYFGTAVHNNAYTVPGYTFTKSVDAGHDRVVFDFTPVTSPTAAAS